MAKDAYIGVRLEHEDRERFYRVAKEEDREPAVLARKVLLEWLDVREQKGRQREETRR